ncbi:hypothetical protein ACFOHW_04485 [Paenibacillus abyssi]
MKRFSICEFFYFPENDHVKRGVRDESGQLPAGKIPVFSAGKALKEALN